MMDEEYQERHLNFTKNNEGSTIEEILLAGLPVHLSTLLVSLVSLLPLDPTSLCFQTLELTGLLAPPLFSLTVFSEEPQLINAVLSLLIVIVFLVIFFKKKGAKDLKKLWDVRVSDEGTLDSLTNFRSSMLLVTAICILAVDFPVFPRKFGKTESFGYGLMDMGVGGFVFAAGLTSPEGRGKETSIVKTIRSSLPLLLLGLARLSVITVTGYHSNVTEYGVHWNFFFSLFFVKVLGSIFIPNIPGDRSIWVCSVVVAVVYEGFLSFGLVDWILSEEPRSGLLDSNKEGICSTLGYMAIYLAGVSWAKEIIHKPLNFTMLANVLTDVCVWSGLMWLSLVYSSTFFLPPSRRLANYTFFTFVVAYSLSILAGFLIIEALVIVIGEWKCGTGSDGGRKDKKSRYILNRKKLTEPEISRAVQVNYAKGLRAPTLYKAMSYNALPYFLLSNLLTGAVNLVVPTMETDGCPAILVLSTYLLLLSFFSMTLYHRKLKLI